MSGGHFDYYQYRIDDIYYEIERLIALNDSTEKDDFGYDIGRHYSPETIAKFREAVTVLKKAAIMAQRIDWLLCGDDGEETFHQRWDEDLKAVAQIVEGE